MNTVVNEQFLAVDIGNNQTKLGLFSTGGTGGLPQLGQIRIVPSSDTTFDSLGPWLPPDGVEWQVATVNRKTESRLAAWVERERPGDAYQCLENDGLPIEVRVDFPKQVGTDRLLAAVAVNHLREAGRSAIVVDAGSAITVDLVSVDGAFEGGVILPGLQMTAKALAQGTDLLPLVEQPIVLEAPPVVGKSTVEAIRSGLFWGSVGAVRELIARISRDQADCPQLFVAGGDAGRLAPYLADNVHVVRELVLTGIAVARQASRR